MNAILKGLVGASVLLGAIAMSASAQDYTWTLVNMEFGQVNTFGGSNMGTEHPDATVSGTIVLTRNGLNYSVKSFNLTTTAGSVGGSAPTGYASVYNSANGASFNTDPGTPLTSFLDIEDEIGDYKLHLAWSSGSLFDPMEFDSAGEVVTLSAGFSSERPVLASTTTPVRFGGSGACFSPPFDACTNDPSPGYLVLALGDTTIEQPPSRVPEPASMALFGAGILGLYAARRRRAG